VAALPYTEFSESTLIHEKGQAWKPALTDVYSIIGEVKP
jgi:hypothetical protein